METVLMIVAFGALLYFLMIRPQQKRAKEQKEKLSQLASGARVMTVSGIVGTVKHVGEKQIILELAPGVEMTVVKAAISTQPVEDEFEYAADEGDDAPAEVEPQDYASGLPAAAEPVGYEPAGYEESSYDSFSSFDPAPPASGFEDPAAPDSKN